MSAGIALAQADVRIGVYYFPGWTDKSNEWWSPPWNKIKPYPERKPLLGYYPEGKVWVSEKHIEWMHSYGIDFVIYDWYWTENNSPKLDHALQAYLKSKNKGLVEFTILWANHYQVPKNLEHFTSMVDYWIENYFKQKQFLLHEGKPVVLVFSPWHLRESATKFGKTVGELFDIARIKAIKAGYKGVYFVGSTQAQAYWVLKHMPANGYDALTAYNYHKGLSGKYINDVAKPLAVSFADLAAGYKESWTWILENSQLPYFIPVTAGWNKRPWGSNTPHDNSSSTPESFEKHLIEAKKLVEKYPVKTLRTVIICAWNEFGEGSYIEPTEKWGMRYLKAVRKVFGNDTQR
jgi:hypothetical protein